MIDNLEAIADNIFGNTASRLAALVKGCIDKEPEQLTDQERLAIAIMGGCNFVFTETGIRVTDAFAIQKIGGQFRVCIRRKTEKGDDGIA